MSIILHLWMILPSFPPSFPPFFHPFPHGTSLLAVELHAEHHVALAPAEGQGPEDQTAPLLPVGGEGWVMFSKTLGGSDGLTMIYYGLVWFWHVLTWFFMWFWDGLNMALICFNDCRFAGKHGGLNRPNILNMSHNCDFMRFQSIKHVPIDPWKIGVLLAWAKECLTQEKRCFVVFTISKWKPTKSGDTR